MYAFRPFGKLDASSQADQIRQYDVTLHKIVAPSLGLIPPPYGAIAQQADTWLYDTLQKPGVVEWLLAHNPITPHGDAPPPIPQPASQDGAAPLPMPGPHA